ncbi:hypothetical protein ACFW04_014692 [Cataglyphis niger]
MYTAGGNHMNYYIPIQDAPLYKKKKCDNLVTQFALGRRYALTPTSYKYLEIAISVGAVSCVQLVLGDNRGNQVVLPFETWKSLIQKRGHRTTCTITSVADSRFSNRSD